MRALKAGVAAAWIALSAWIGLETGFPFALANPPSATLLVYALSTGFRPAIAGAVAWLLPALSVLALRDAFRAATALLLALYLAELADVAAQATATLSLGYVEERVKQITRIAALALVSTWGALALGGSLPLELDFWAVAAALIALAAMAVVAVKGGWR